jgi:hypothetical protein
MEGTQLRLLVSKSVLGSKIRRVDETDCGYTTLYFETAAIVQIATLSG